MYSVVGCRECDALWIVEGRPDTTECRRCGSRHSFDRLKRLARADDRDEAVEARSALLSERSGQEEAHRQVTSADVGEAVSDEEYLERKGVDPDAVAAVDDDGPGNTSRRETVLAAIRELERPTEAEVIDYASARGVPSEYVRKALSKLRESGEVSRSDGRYRLL